MPKKVRVRRVIQYLDSTHFGGCEQVVLSLLRELKAGGNWEPHLLFHDSAGIARLKEGCADLGIQCTALPPVRDAGAVAGAIRLAPKISVIGAEVFHAHLNWPLGCRTGIIAAALARVPVRLATAHLFFPIYDVRHARLKQRVQSTLLDQYLVVSDEVRARFESELAVPASRIRVVRNGIDVDSFRLSRDEALRISLGVDRSQALVITPARLHPQKGISFLLEAVPRVPNAIFLIVGEGPERARLEMRAKDLHIEGRVRFLGHRKDVPHLMAASDLFVLPSLYEGLPLTVLEAMAAGLPVVATQIGGTSEAVVHGVTGLLVPSSDSNALADAIVCVLEDVELAHRLGAAGRSRVESEFSAQSMARGVERAYLDLVRGGPSAMLGEAGA